MEIRIGQGFDVHPFGEERPLLLAGVRIPFPRGLGGHSDADVLSHALCDALLGAANLGDLGSHFPDTDPRWAGAGGLDLLRAVHEKVEADRWSVVNADLTLLGEEPRIALYRTEMRANLAAAIGVPPASVSLKATTLEGLGALGRREGLAALALALLTRE